MSREPVHPRRRWFIKRVAALLPTTLVGPAMGGVSLFRGVEPVSGIGSHAASTGGPAGKAGSIGLTPPPIDAPFQVETQFFAPTRFQQALDALSDGGTLCVRGGASYQVTGVLYRNDVTIRAVGGKAVLDGRRDPGLPAQGKALIVQKGRAAKYENLIFRNIVVPDQNGAGVRIEGAGETTFWCCGFGDSQQGILTYSNPDCRVVMLDCNGENLGAGDGYSHGVYCGTIGSLTVIGGSWTDSNTGHLIKSRASRTRIESVSLVEGRASRAIDVPDGGAVEILDCTIMQSRATGNSEIIGYGLEAKAPYWPTNSFTFRATNVVTNTRTPPGSVMVFARWFTGPKLVERYTYNGSSSNPPGFTG